MKLLKLAPLVTIALAGAATAQPSPGVAFYGNGVYADSAPSSSGVRWQTPRSNPNAQEIAAGLKVAMPQMHLACAADRQSLCADKTTDRSADRCLNYHRLKLSTPCKQAWVKVSLAREGAL
jgi:hypothetical protein